MLGPIVNALVVVVCALIGCFVLRGIPGRFEELIKKGVGICTLFLGIKGAMESGSVLLLIMSVVIGGVIGELINIDKWINRLGLWAEKKLARASENKNAPRTYIHNAQRPHVHNAHNAEPDAEGAAAPAAKKSFSKGFVTASILYCTGSMAIIGSMQSGLQGNHEILFAKSVLDGSMSIVFGASLGIGVAFSAVPILVYQGGIALASMGIKEYLTPEIISEMSAVGSILIAAIGINFVVPEGHDRREIKVANLIPAVFIPWVYLTAAGLLGL